MSESKPEETQKQLEEFRTWVNDQPHLPKDLDDIILRRYLHSCYYDMEKAKSALQWFFSIREESPELLNDRDPMCSQMQDAFQTLRQINYLTSSNKRVWIWQINDPGLKVYNCLIDAKLFFMASDAWLLTDPFIQDADIILVDAAGVTFKFLTKFNLSIQRKLSRYQQDALPIRLKQVHIVNAPWFINKLFTIMKPLLNEGVLEMVHFHLPNSDTIFNHISKEDLPEDLGGSLPKVEDQMKEAVKNIISKRDLFVHNSFWRVDKKEQK